MITIVVPTISGREEWLSRCLASYRECTPDCEIIVVKDRPSCGQAWIEGYAQSTGDYVHLTADDITCEPGWWEEPAAAVEQDAIPVARVVGPTGFRMDFPAQLGDLGVVPSIGIPFLSRAQLEEGGWLLPIHYGQDDWIAYLATKRGKELRRCDGYGFVHHFAPEGRNWTRQGEDLLMLVEAMRAEGYVPPLYLEELE